MRVAVLTALLYPKTSPACVRLGPDCAQLHLELRRRAVTLALLHVEYTGWSSRRDCDTRRSVSAIAKWLEAALASDAASTHWRVTSLFVDYAGMKPKLFDPLTGEFIAVELFVAVLGASNYTYAEATRTQQVADFVSSVARALTFFGGVPRAIVPDQLKSAVIKACRYDPAVQRTTAELGRYYNTTILPARPMSPRDKAKVEVGVQIAERWLLARIRNETFTSLADLNRRLFELTEIINTRPMRAYNASRRELFERLDKPALGPLPAEPFQASSWKEVRLNIDYHVEFERHLYSAPHTLLREELWVRATARARFEIFSPRRPCRLSRAQLRSRRSHDHARVHAEYASRSRRMGRRLASSVGQRPWVKTHALSVM